MEKYMKTGNVFEKWLNITMRYEMGNETEKWCEDDYPDFGHHRH